MVPVIGTRRPHSARTIEPRAGTTYAGPRCRCFHQPWNDRSFRTLNRVSSPTNEAITMGSTADKASGLANEAAGKAKQGIGNVVGSDKLKTEGAAQELKGDAQKATGDAKAAVKDAANKTADAINKNL
jgi:uncharacterized protein YjbJ (UPF0337 family)